MRYPLLLDELILRDFAMYLGMILVSFILLTLVFTFFELLGDIVRNHIPMIMVGQYLLNVTPSMIYIMTPLSVLLAVLTTIGLLQKTNEITAMKATGTSIYRVIFPIFVIAAAISTGLFFFDQLYIPAANQRQETLRNQIKGKPAQTYLRPDRKWIFGEHNTIYYYEFFDPDQNTFANVTAFEFDPKSFELTGRVHASRAHWSDELNKWIFEQGWARTFHGSDVQSFHQFDAETFPTLIEPPGYFKKEVRQSSEMNYQELRCLHRRSAAERLRRGAPAGAVAEEVCLSADYACDGDPRRTLLTLRRTQGRAHRHRRSPQRGDYLLRRRRTLRGHGQCQPIARRHGCLGSRPHLRIPRRISAAEGPNIGLESGYLSTTAALEQELISYNS